MKTLKNLNIKKLQNSLKPQESLFSMSAPRYVKHQARKSIKDINDKYGNDYRFIFSKVDLNTDFYVIFFLLEFHTNFII